MRAGDTVDGNFAAEEIVSRGNPAQLDRDRVRRAEMERAVRELSWPWWLALSLSVVFFGGWLLSLAWTEPIDTAGLGGTAATSEPPVPAEADDPAEASESGEASDSADGTDSAEASDSGEASDSAHGSESGEAADSADGSDELAVVTEPASPTTVVSAEEAVTTREANATPIGATTSTVDAEPPTAIDGAATLNEQLALEPISFRTASSRLATSSKAVLDRVGSYLLDHEQVRVEVAGHTDSDGKASDNLRLSKNRAQSVVDYLVEFGVDEDRLTAVGYGDTEPLVSNDSAAGKKKNRRIEFNVMAGG